MLEQEADSRLLPGSVEGDPAGAWGIANGSETAREASFSGLPKVFVICKIGARRKVPNIIWDTEPEGALLSLQAAEF